MADKNEDDRDLVFKSNIYKEYCLKKEQILKYKWIESEKQGRDIGLDKAWIQWESKYYRAWQKNARPGDDKSSSGQTDAPD